jgi:hypothetical protein
MVKSIARFLRLWFEFDEVLSPKSTTLRDNFQAFGAISDRFDIYTICDTLGSGSIMGLAPGFKELYVEPMDYILGLPNEQVIGINADYEGMVKLLRYDSNYFTVLAILKSINKHGGILYQDHQWRSHQTFRLEEWERYVICAVSWSEDALRR